MMDDEDTHPRDEVVLPAQKAGMAAKENPTIFAQKAQSVRLTTQQVSDIASEYKNNTKGSNCN